MGIRRPICVDCDCIKETKKSQCKFPNEWGKKYGSCSGRIPYSALWKESREFVLKHYKEFR